MEQGKTCARCKEFKPLEDFNKLKGGPLGRQRYCRQCQSEKRNDPKALAETENRRSKIESKNCKNCKVTKPTSEYWETKYTKDGYYSICKTCFQEKYGIGTPAWSARRKHLRENNWSKHILIGCQKRAKEEGVPLDITEEDIIVPDRCPILGIELKAGGGIKADCTPTVDRIEPHKGYVKGNIKVISWKANKIKGGCCDPSVFDAIALYLRQNIK